MAANLQPSPLSRQHRLALAFDILKGAGLDPQEDSVGENIVSMCVNVSAHNGNQSRTFYTAATDERTSGRCTDNCAPPRVITEIMWKLGMDMGTTLREATPDFDEEAISDATDAEISKSIASNKDARVHESPLKADSEPDKVRDIKSGKRNKHSEIKYQPITAYNVKRALNFCFWTYRVKGNTFRLQRCPLNSEHVRTSKVFLVPSMMEGEPPSIYFECRATGCIASPDRNIFAEKIKATLEREYNAAMRAGNENDPVAILAQDVEPEPVEWLWDRRILAKQVNLIEGDPDKGKSNLTSVLAAHVSTGKDWPDGPPCPLGGVVILSTEDSMRSTIMPRLRANGADLSRTAIVYPRYEDEDGKKIFKVPDDLPRIEQAAAQVAPCRLIIIDPFSACLTEEYNTNSEPSMRQLFMEFDDLCERTSAAMAAIRHLNKRSDEKNAMYRGGGSIGIIAAVRAAHLVTYDPSHEEADLTKKRRVFLMQKSNLAPRAPSIAFNIVDCDGVAKVEWVTGTRNILAEEALAAPNAPKLGAAMALVRRMTEEGRCKQADIEAEADRIGVKLGTLKRAKKTLKCWSEKEGYGKDAVTYWHGPGSADAHANEPDPEAKLEFDEKGENEGADD